MVRLVALPIMWARSVICRFNSLMVRLVVKGKDLDSAIPVKFQFLDGAIGSNSSVISL